MSFAEHIAAIPYASTGQATGILAPIVRASGHILFALAATTDEGYTISDEEAIREIDAASEHLITTIAYATNAPISTRAKEMVGHFCNAVAYAHSEISGWDHDTRRTNLHDLANRAAAIAAFFDTELAGATGADAGQSL